MSLTPWLWCDAWCYTYTDIYSISLYFLDLLLTRRGPVFITIVEYVLFYSACVHLGIISLYVYCTHRWGICLSGEAEENRGDVMCIMLYYLFMYCITFFLFCFVYELCLLLWQSYLSIHLYMQPSTHYSTQPSIQ